jgi:lipid II:glycine glycyltransferase (peptidoglycan interpeptide bridge formation enzyme)
VLTAGFLRCSTVEVGITELSAGYSIEVDRITRAEWSALLHDFADASIYQTWSYGAVRWGEKNLSHLVLRQGREAVGMAQVALRKIPFVPAGIAYIPWGPLWKRNGREVDFDVFRRLITGLREEYVGKKGLLLRLNPNEIELEGERTKKILEQEHYTLKSRNYRTLLIDLTRPMEELLQVSSRRWRRALKTARENRLEVKDGTDDTLFQILDDLYHEMVTRKGFVPGVDIKEFRMIQRNLPDNLKMKIMVCEHGGEPVAALMTSLIGTTKGIGLLGATSTRGLNMGAFHLLNWKMMEWMQTSGAAYYDFGGYNPEKNPGTAGFKEGLAGAEVHHVGQYEACSNPLSHLTIKLGERLKAVGQRARFSSKKAARAPEKEPKAESDS